MSNKPYDIETTDYKNLDEELEKEIEKANLVTRTLGESIISVYNLARSKGYTPFQARDIVETRIINVTPQYVRKMLPDEAKQLQVHNRVKEIESRKAKQKFRSSEDLRNTSFAKTKISEGLQEKINQANEAIEEHNDLALKNYGETKQSNYLSKQDIHNMIEKSVETTPIKNNMDGIKFNPSQYTKLVIDLMKVKQSARYTGVFITVDREVIS